MARTTKHRWWLPPLAVLAVAGIWLVLQLVVGGVAALVVLGTGMEAGTGSLTGDTVTDIAVLLVTLTLLIPVVLFVARFVQRRPAGTVSSVVGRLRWGWLFTCVALALPCVLLGIGMVVAIGVSVAPEQAAIEFVGMAEFWVPMVVIVLLVPFQAAGEEYGIRGFLIQAIGSYGRRGGPWLGIIVSTVLFTGLHTQYTGWAVADVALLGVAMAWLIWRTGGLEAAIALHATHNVIAFGLAAWSGNLDRLESSGSLLGLSGTVVELALFVALVVWLANRRGIQRVAPSGPEPPQGTDPYGWPETGVPGPRGPWPTPGPPPGSPWPPPDGHTYQPPR